MIRQFNQHKIRTQKELEGYWDFEPLIEKNLPKTYSHKMYVPFCWENDIKFCKYRGYGAYRKLLLIEEPGFYKLSFKGVSHTAKVFVDGQMLSEHYNAYTGFDVTFTALESRVYRLEVIVDNTFSKESALHVPNDYFTYGGIIRPVVLEKLAEVYINQVQFTPEKEDGTWWASICIKIINRSEIDQTFGVKLKLDDIELVLDGEEKIQLSGKQIYTLKHRIKFENVKEWNQKSPQLYFIRVDLFNIITQDLIDDLIERVGFRTIKVVNKELLLNDQKIFLQGFNRHEDFNVFGASIPTQAMAIDLAILRDLGSNSIRTAHYPNDERFLDMCDELGIVIWEESHARGLSIEQMHHPKFNQQSEDCIREMIRDHYNHPSIIIWGILNECASHNEDGREVYQRQFEQIKLLDKSRALTFASDKHFSDICLDLVDILSVNIYFGWYDECGSVDAIRRDFEKEIAWLKKAGGEKPIIISEFGAGAIYGYRAPHEPMWSEEKQAAILRESLEIFQKSLDVVGLYIWQYCDVRVTEEIWGISRPRTMNNKGIVDEYRRPKLAYGTVKSAFLNRFKKI